MSSSWIVPPKHPLATRERKRLDVNHARPGSWRGTALPESNSATPLRLLIPDRIGRRLMIWLIGVALFVLGPSGRCRADETTQPTDSAGAAVVPADSPQPSDAVVLRGATVHPVNGPAIPNGLIVIRDGKLEFVGPANAGPEIQSPIDCVGKHIYPGLIDADTALGLVEIDAVRATVDTAETGLSNPNVQAVVAFNPDSELIPVARADGILLAHTVPNGGLISGQSALVSLQGWNELDMVMSPTVGLHIHWPNAGTFRAWFSDRPARKQHKERAQRLQQLSEMFGDARRYAAARAADTDTPFDPRLEAITAAALGQLPVFVHADELRQIQEAISFANREQLSLVIVGGADAAECAELLKKHEVPVIVTGTLRLPQSRNTAYDEPYTLPARLHAAGVRFCLAGYNRFGASAIRNLPQQAGTAAAHGLPADIAVRSITLSAAEILGVADRVGSLEAGKDATLIVTDNDVLEVASRVELAYIQGAPVDLDSRHKRLWRKYQRKYDGSAAVP